MGLFYSLVFMLVSWLAMKETLWSTLLTLCIISQFFIVIWTTPLYNPFDCAGCSVVGLTTLRNRLYCWILHATSGFMLLLCFEIFSVTTTVATSVSVWPFVGYTALIRCPALLQHLHAFVRMLFISVISNLNLTDRKRSRHFNCCEWMILS
jgi:hypothetical protein